MAFLKLSSQMEDHNSDPNSETLHKSGDSSTSNPHHTTISLMEKQNNLSELSKDTLTKAHQSGQDPDMALLCYRSTPINSKLPSPAELTRMHSSRMCTGCSLKVCCSLLLGGVCLVRGGSPWSQGGLLGLGGGGCLPGPRGFSLVLGVSAWSGGFSLVWGCLPLLGGFSLVQGGSPWSGGFSLAWGDSPWSGGFSRPPLLWTESQTPAKT